LDAKARAEIQFWLENIESVNGYPIAEPAGYSATVYSDASDTGYAGYCADLPAASVQGAWRETEARQSSTWRELTAIQRTLHALSAQLAGRKIRWYTDSSNSVSIITKGSRKAHLHSVAVEILLLCRQHCIILLPVWISRKHNTLADKMSRIPDRDDWALEPRWFMELDRLWGPHTCDRFATQYNAQLSCFNSKVWSPGTSGVDCLLQDWSHDNNWLCPPVHLILQAVAHAQRQRAQATLVVPLWESAFYWPTLCPQGGEAGWAKFVADFLILDAGYIPSSADVNGVFNLNPAFQTLALCLRW